MSQLRRMMYGRYGMDPLNAALLGLYLLSACLRVPWLHWLSLAALALALLRMFSRRTEKRRAENEKFLSAIRPLIQKYNAWRCQRNDREHAYFRCPGCGQRLRAPKGKGKISVTCRACGATFEKKT